MKKFKNQLKHVSNDINERISDYIFKKSLADLNITIMQPGKLDKEETKQRL